jgi:DNA-binding PadR family transcriptional regulator
LADGFARVDTERVLGVGRSRAGALLKELTESGLLTNTSPATGLLNTAKYFLTEKGRARAEELESLEVARKKREGS